MSSRSKKILNMALEIAEVEPVEPVADNPDTIIMINDLPIIFVDDINNTTHSLTSENCPNFQKSLLTSSHPASPKTNNLGIQNIFNLFLDHNCLNDLTSPTNYVYSSNLIETKENLPSLANLPINISETESTTTNKDQLISDKEENKTGNQQIFQSKFAESNKPTLEVFSDGLTNNNQDNIPNTDVSESNIIINTVEPHYELVADCETEEQEGSKVKRRKRCQVNKSAWADRQNASQREKGQQYLSRKKQNGKWDKVPRRFREIKARCKCLHVAKSLLKCSKISDIERKQIFDSFWLMSWGEKRIYVDHLVNMLPTIRPRDRKNETSTKRVCSMYYHLKINDELFRVCKTMFLNTLDIGKTAVWNWKNSSKQDTQTAKNSNRLTTELISARKSRINVFQKQLDSLKEFLTILPKMESHYCRKETSKYYLLPEWSCKKALYDWYVSDWCSSHNITKLSVATFNNTLATENISLFQPKKDACERCQSHKLGFISDDEHRLHIERKEEARSEKERDKVGNNYVFAVDVQALLSAPKSNVSSLYYKSKLNIHNFCAFNLKTKEAYCFLWNETEGGVSANEFASIVVNLIINKVLPEISAEDIDKKIIIYSDGCAAQNRNVTVSNALLNMAMVKGITVEQKYLEVGHTQMEVDSMHASIERLLRNKVINVPAEYIVVCRCARKIPKPYNVDYLTHSFFKSYDGVKYLKSIRPGRTKGDLKVTDMRALQYLPNGEVFYKVKFSEEWMLLPQRRDCLTPQEFSDLPNLHSSRLPLTQRKYQDLQDLKMTIHADYHAYYDNLPHQ